MPPTTTAAPPETPGRPLTERPQILGFVFLISDTQANRDLGYTDLIGMRCLSPSRTDLDFRILPSTEDEEEWRLIVKYLGVSSEHRAALKSTEYESAYLLGDGYGRISAAEARAQCWDWSHIRDSSDDAKRAIARYLRALGYTDPRP